MTHGTMENLNKYKTIEKEVGNCQDTEREAKHGKEVGKFRK